MSLPKETFDTLLQTLNNLDFDTIKHDTNIAKLMSNLLTDLNYMNSIDHELIDTLQSLGSCTYDEIDESNDYIILYFPTAALYKVYKPEDIDDFVKHMITYFRNKELYEIVKDNKKQKIIIMYDNIDDAELNKMKSYILQFTNTFFKTADNLTEDDILILKNIENNQSEIIINRNVNNVKETEVFCNSLVKYIQEQEGNGHIARAIVKDKLGNKYNDIIKIGDATCYGHNGFQDLIKDRQKVKRGMISYVNNSNNIYQINYINIDTINNIVINNNNYLGSNSGDFLTINDFVRYIKSQRPIWYLPNNMVPCSDIYDKYKELGGQNMGMMTFARKLKGKIHNGQDKKRKNNKTLWNLFAWDKIQEE